MRTKEKRKVTLLPRERDHHPWRKFRIGIHSDICIRANANQYEKRFESCLFVCLFVEKHLKINPTLSETLSE